VIRITSLKRTVLPQKMVGDDPPATGAELRAGQIARLHEEMRRREADG
jgi:hypothetical protein